MAEPTNRMPMIKLPGHIESDPDDAKGAAKSKGISSNAYPVINNPALLSPRSKPKREDGLLDIEPLRIGIKARSSRGKEEQVKVSRTAVAQARKRFSERGSIMINSGLHTLRETRGSIAKTTKRLSKKFSSRLRDTSRIQEDTHEEKQSASTNLPENIEEDPSRRQTLTRATGAQAAWHNSLMKMSVMAKTSSFMRNSTHFNSGSFRRDLGTHTSASAGLQGRSQRGIMSPHNRFVLGWSSIHSLLIIYTAIVIPFEVGFSQRHSSNLMMMTIDIIIDFFFMADIILNFRIGFYEGGQLIMDADRISRRYLKTYFIADCIASFPFIIDIGQIFWDIAYLKLLKMFRLIRVIRSIAYVQTNSSESANVTSLALVRIIKLILYALVMSHFTACLRHGILLLDDTAYDAQIDSGRGIKFAYLDSMFWSLGLMTGLRAVGWPSSALEAVFTLVVLLMGVFLFAIVIGNLGEVVEHAGARFRDHQQRKSKLAQFIRHYNIDKELGKDMIEYFQYRWDLGHGFDADEIKKPIPSCIGLNADVALFLAQSMLEKVQIFRKISIVVLAEIAKRLKMVTVAPNEDIIKQGDEPADFMCFISHGTFDVIVDDLKISTLEERQHFGETALFSPEKRSHTFRATRFCEVWILMTADFCEVMSAYPQETAATWIEVKKKEQRLIKHTTDVMEERRATKRATAGPMFQAGLAKASNKYKAGGIATSAFAEESTLDSVLDETFDGLDGEEDTSNHVRFTEDSKTVYFINLIVRTLHIYNALVISTLIGFRLNSFPPFSIVVIDLVADVYIILWILVHFNVSISQFGVQVLDRSEIQQIYLRSWFFFDILTILPLNLIDVFNPLWRLPRFLGLIRYFSIGNKSATNHQKSNLWRLIAALLTCLILIHFVSCGYWIHTFIEGYGSGSHDEFLPPEFLREAGIFDQYVKATLFSLKALTGRGNPFIPKTELQLTFALVCTMLGLFGVGFVIGNISLLVIHMNPLQGQHKHRVGDTLQFMHLKQFPVSLQMRVLRYLDYRWQRENGISIADALNELPLSLEKRVRKHLVMKHLSDLPMFKHTSHKVLEVLMMKVRFGILPPDEYLYYEGQIGDDLFIIAEGAVMMELSDGHKPFQFNEGSFIGEEAILDENGLRSSTIRTLTSSTFLAFSVSALEDALHLESKTKGRLMRGLHIRQSVGQKSDLKETYREQVQLMLNDGIFWFSSKSRTSHNVQTGEELLDFFMAALHMTPDEADNTCNTLLQMNFLAPHGMSADYQHSEASRKTKKTIRPFQLYHLVIPGYIEAEYHNEGSTRRLANPPKTVSAAKKQSRSMSFALMVRSK